MESALARVFRKVQPITMDSEECAAMLWVAAIVLRDTHGFSAKSLHEALDIIENIKIGGDN